MAKNLVKYEKKDWGGFDLNHLGMKGQKVDRKKPFYDVWTIILLLVNGFF